MNSQALSPVSPAMQGLKEIEAVIAVLDATGKAVTVRVPQSALVGMLDAVWAEQSVIVSANNVECCPKCGRGYGRPHKPTCAWVAKWMQLRVLRDAVGDERHTDTSEVG